MQGKLFPNAFLISIWLVKLINLQNKWKEKPVKTELMFGGKAFPNCRHTF